LYSSFCIKFTISFRKAKCFQALPALNHRISGSSGTSAYSASTALKNWINFLSLDPYSPFDDVKLVEALMVNLYACKSLAHSGCLWMMEWNLGQLTRHVLLECQPAHFFALMPSVTTCTHFSNLRGISDRHEAVINVRTNVPSKVRNQCSLYSLYTAWNDSLVMCLHDCAIACALKQIFAQFKFY